MHDPVIHVYGDAAWSEMTWTFHAIEKHGNAIATEGRETQVYHKESGAWHIVLVHYSGPPEKARESSGGTFARDNQGWSCLPGIARVGDGSLIR